MSMSIVAGLLIPFLGTTAGAACVFFLKKQIGGNIQRIFTGFAAGVMVAASVWSLLIPAMDMCEEMGKLAFLPAVIGFLIGIVFLLFIDSMVPHLHVGSDAPEGHKSSLNRTAMLMLAVTVGSLIAKKHKILAAVAVFYGIHVLISIATAFLMSANDVLSDGALAAMSGFFGRTALLMTALSLGGYFLMYWLVDRKLNLN